MTLATNILRLRSAIEWAENHPEEWSQAFWAVIRDTSKVVIENNTFTLGCGTSCCIAGHAAMMAGYKFQIDEYFDQANYCVNENGKVRYIADVAAEYFGLERSDADRLFASYNTLEDLKRMVDFYSENGTMALPKDEDV